LDLGEILFLKKPASRLFVEVNRDREEYSPGDTVNWEVTVRDEQGNLVEDDTYVSLFVTDDSVFSKIEQK